jgi:general secretion pathway protein G
MKFLFLLFALMVSEMAIPAAERSIVVGVRADMFGGIKTALDRFKIDCGRYPTTSEGFAGMVNCPTNFSGGKWSGPYLDNVPIDPWGNVYVYRCPGIHNTNGYDLYSCGFDGISKSGGEDLDDINNWDPQSPLAGTMDA